MCVRVCVCVQCSQVFFEWRDFTIFVYTFGSVLVGTQMWLLLWFVYNMYAASNRGAHRIAWVIVTLLTRLKRCLNYGVTYKSIS